MAGLAAKQAACCAGSPLSPSWFCSPCLSRTLLHGRPNSLPIAGPWGDVEAKGCDDYRGETEGGYIVVDKDGRGWGSGGECGCKVKSVKKSGESEYAIVASCQCIDGPKETWHRKLIVLSDSEIEWNGTKYQKCKPLP